MLLGAPSVATGAASLLTKFGSCPNDAEDIKLLHAHCAAATQDGLVRRRRLSMRWAVDLAITIAMRWSISRLTAAGSLCSAMATAFATEHVTPTK